MKSIVILLLILSPLAALCQCPTYFGGSITEAMKLAPIVEQYTQFKMNMKDTTDNYNAIAFRDSLGFSTLRITVSRYKKMEGTQIVYSAPVVTSIQMSGPADRIDKLMKEYFEPKVMPCKTESSPTWIFWGSEKIIFHTDDTHEGIPMKFIRIEKL